MKIELDNRTRLLMQEYRSKQEQYETAGEKVRDAFKPLAKQAILLQDWDKARELARLCPCPVGSAFIRDAIRQALIKRANQG